MSELLESYNQAEDLETVDPADIPADHVSFNDADDLMTVENETHLFARFNSIANEIHGINCRDFWTKNLDGINYSSISFPSKDYWKCELYADVYWNSQFTLEITKPSKKFNLSRNQVRNVLDKIVEKKDQAKLKRDSLRKNTNNLLLWAKINEIPTLNFQEVYNCNISFNMDNDNYEFGLYSNNWIWTRVKIKNNTLRVGSYDQNFSIDEWLRVACLLNKIKIKKYQQHSYWHFQRSTFWDLERDIKNNPFDENILENKVLKKYFPSIHKSQKFLDYLNRSYNL